MSARAVAFPFDSSGWTKLEGIPFSDYFEGKEGGMITPAEGKKVEYFCIDPGDEKWGADSHRSKDAMFYLSRQILLKDTV